MGENGEKWGIYFMGNRENRLGNSPFFPIFPHWFPPDKRLTVTGLPVHDNGGGGGLKLDVFSALMLRSWRCSADSCSMSRIFRKLEMMEVSVVTTACCRRVYR